MKIFTQNTGLFFKVFTKKFFEHDIIGRSAQVSWFFLLSFFPIVLFLILLLPFLNIDITNAFTQLSLYLPPEIAQVITTILENLLVNSSNLALGVTFLIIFWTSTGATNSFLININEMHDFDYRGSLNSYFLRFAFTIVFILLIVFFVFLLPFGVNSLNDLIPFDLLFLIKFLDKIILPLLVFIIIFNLFYFGPKVYIKKRNAFYGTSFTIVGFLIMTKLFSLYLQYFPTLSITYGSLGTIIVFLLWVNLICMITLMGALITNVLEKTEFIK